MTFSGGDPLHEKKQGRDRKTGRRHTGKFPDKTIWLYTGYEWEEICGIPFLPNIDVIVDGEFKIEEKDNSLHWKGSANQRVIDVKESLKTGKVQLYRKY